MKTIQELNDMDPEEFSAYFRVLTPAQEYLETMRWIWALEPWKECPGEWDWAVVMKGYENILAMEAVGER